MVKKLFFLSIITGLLMSCNTNNTKHQSTKEAMDNSDNTTSKTETAIEQVQNLPYDKLMFSSSICFGKCPDIDVIVDKEGKAIFHIKRFAEPLGFYTGQLSQEQITQLNTLIKSIDVDKLSAEYTAKATDMTTYYSAFVNDNKIVKLVKDYGKKGPKELVQLYDFMSTLHSSIQLDSMELKSNNYLMLHIEGFKMENKNYYVKKTESFYLWNLLRNSSTSDASFTAKYDVVFSDNYSFSGSDELYKKRKREFTISTIKSDGRYFQFTLNDGRQVTYDLGFNYLENNASSVEFK